MLPAADNGENRENCEKVVLLHKALINYSGNDESFKVKFERLLKHKGDINYKIFDGSGGVTNILHFVYEQHQINLHDIFKSLLNCGVDFTLKNRHGRTIVHEIIRNIYRNNECHEYIEFIDSILSAHVRFHNFSNPSDCVGFTHFHAACIRDHVEAVQFFLKNGADVNLSLNRNSPQERLSSSTPLHFSVEHGSPKVMEILLKYGANVHTKNFNGFNPLHMIVAATLEKTYENEKERSRYETMFNIFLKFFIADDSESAEVDEFGFCKLHAACLLQDPLIAEDLLARVTNINQAVNSDSPIFPGYTALHFAASCNVKIFELLVKNGADIGVKNASGLTPFDLLLHNCKIEQIQSVLLIKPEWKDILLYDGQTKLVEVISALGSYDKLVSFYNNKKRVLKSYVPKASPLWPGYTVLHLAVAYEKKTWQLSNRESYSSICLCLEAGASVTIKNAHEGFTPLHLAFHLQKHYLVQFLLCHHMQPKNPVDPNQLSHLHIACVEGDLAVVKLLLPRKGVDVNLPVISTLKYRQIGSEKHTFFITAGSTALHINAARGDRRITKTLLKNGANVNAQDANGFTPVHRLLSSNALRLYDLLLSHKHLKNITSPCGLSHLHIAFRFGHNDAIFKLLKLGGDVKAPVTHDKYDWKMSESERNLVDLYGIPHRPLASLSKRDGFTPIHFNCSFCRPSSLLLEKNVDLLAKNNHGICPLEISLRKRNFYDEDFKILEENIALQTYLINEYGMTMLHVYCFSANVKLVENLLKDGANVNAKVNSLCLVWRGYTPLHCVMEKLLKNPEDKSLVDRLTKIGQLLVEHGADVLLKNDNCDTPFHMIYKMLNFKCDHGSAIRKLSKAFSLLSMLFENLKNVQVNPTNYCGLSLFHIACIVFHVDAVRKFLESGVNVNQAIEYFSRHCPESTALHLVIVTYHTLNNDPRKLTTKYDEAFINVVDLLLENGANVNATDTFGDTPFFDAVKLNSLRTLLIKKLMSHGANIHAMNHRRETALELLLKKQKNVTWEELELFLNASPEYLFNMYSQSFQGYLGLLFRFHQDFKGLTTIMDKSIVHRIVDHPKIIEITSSGRSIIHNIVCVEPMKSDNTGPLTVRRFPYRFFLFKSAQWPVENYLFYKELIEQLLIRGCDIDHQDNEGKTALHLSMDFGNEHAITALLKNGADINITDNRGKTALHYCYSKTRLGFLFNENTRVKKAYSLYAYKMIFCGLHVNEQYEELLDPDEFQFLGKEVKRFHEEMDQTKSLNIGKTSLSLYEFLMRNDIGTVYMNMKYEERREVDQFFEKIGAQNFSEIDCLLKLKYRKTIERKQLLGPALESINILRNHQLPDLCVKIIFKSLCNADLKRLIASVNE